MRRTTTLLGSLLLFGAGYFLGTADLSLTRPASAQNAQDAQNADNQAGPAIELAEDTQNKIHDANLSLQDAMDALQGEGRYGSITDGINAFLVFTGGGNAMEDIESGQGVDPETFAALYAGQAIPEVKDHLAKDDEGRLTYKGKVVRMYSEDRLMRAFAVRSRLANPGL